MVRCVFGRQIRAQVCTGLESILRALNGEFQVIALGHIQTNPMSHCIRMETAGGSGQGHSCLNLRVVLSIRK